MLWTDVNAFIDQFLSFWKSQSWPLHSKSNISTTTSATTTIDTPLEGLLIAHLLMKSVTQNLFKRLRYMVLS